MGTREEKKRQDMTLILPLLNLLSLAFLSPPYSKPTAAIFSGCNTESMARAGSNRLHSLFQIKMMNRRASVLFKPAIPTALPQKTV